VRLLFRLSLSSGEEFMMAKTKPSWPGVTGPLAEYAGGFRAELARLGYTPLTAASQLRLVAHLSRWLAAEGLDASALTAPVVERFFACRRSAGYANERTAAALGPLLGYLRGLGASPVAVAESTATGQLLARYASYLVTERGLAQTTVALNVRLVRPFLLQRAQERDGRLDPEQLTAAEVRVFVVAQSRQRPRSCPASVSGWLRSRCRKISGPPLMRPTLSPLRQRPR
jgi:integrase/recombinase XerD